MKRIREDRVLQIILGVIVLCGLSGFAHWAYVASSAYIQGSLTPQALFAAVGVADTAVSTPEPEPVYYIEVTGSCDEHYEGECVNVRSGAGEDYPVIARVRSGIVLRVDGTTENAGRTWYKIIFDEGLRYPERLTTREWYIAGEFARPIPTILPETLTPESATTTKRILVDRSDQKLYAYDGDVLFSEENISTGRTSTPTPLGTFTIFKKTPSRYMQGPLPGISDQYFDLPGVPWNLYFTQQGAVIHGAYWHDKFGQQWSNGCVNLPPDRAEFIYRWADIGTTVTVQE